MGIKKRLKGFLTKQQKRETQERNERVEEFKAEYRELRARFGFDFRSYLSYLDEGQGIVAAMKIIDVSDEVKAEAEAEERAKIGFTQEKRNGDQKPEN